MAILSAVKSSHWVISRKAIQTGISEITVILDIVSISYSTMWYLIPMSQYFLCVYILVQSLHNTVSHLHSEDLNTIKLQRIALNIRSIVNVCDLVKDYYGITLLLGVMCSVLDSIFFPYLYVYATHLLKLRLLSNDSYKILLCSMCGFAALSKLFHMYTLFMVCEKFYDKKSDIKNRLHQLLKSTKPTKYRLNRQIFFMSLRYTEQEDKITVAGILDLTYKQLFSIISSAIAFMVIQVQFVIQDVIVTTDNEGGT
ncbi:hypothetical protein WDU94_001198 [Cyamophila willieti]